MTTLLSSTLKAVGWQAVLIPHADTQGGLRAEGSGLVYGRDVQSPQAVVLTVGPDAAKAYGIKPGDVVAYMRSVGEDAQFELDGVKCVVANLRSHCRKCGTGNHSHDLWGVVEEGRAVVLTGDEVDEYERLREVVGQLAEFAASESPGAGPIQDMVDEYERLKEWAAEAGLEVAA